MERVDGCCDGRGGGKDGIGGGWRRGTVRVPSFDWRGRGGVRGSGQGSVVGVRR